MLLTMFLYAIGLYLICGICTIIFDAVYCNTDTGLTTKRVFGIEPIPVHGTSWWDEFKRFLLLGAIMLIFWPLFVALYKAKG